MKGIRITAMLLVLAAAPAAAQQQMVDPDYIPQVASPTYAADGPAVVIDEAHQNFHTASGQYSPFAGLLAADGFTVTAGVTAFDDATLGAVKILVIANPGSARGVDVTTSAFSEAEIDALDRWVRSGGSMLLIADHAPFGLAASALARKFGVDMGQGWAFERNAAGDGLTTQLTYTRADGDLASHPITEGRGPSERVETVRTFTGQSLVGPEGATVLLRFSEQAWEAPDQGRLNAANETIATTGTEVINLEGVASFIGGRAQGLAFEHGEGRVVVLGEAGMFSAQLVRFPPQAARPDIRFGMNVARENGQFALNVMHWLARTLP